MKFAELWAVLKKLGKFDIKITLGSVLEAYTAMGGNLDAALFYLLLDSKTADVVKATGLTEEQVKSVVKAQANLFG